MQNRDTKHQSCVPPVFSYGNLAQFGCAAVAGTISQFIFYPTSTSLTRIQVHTSPIRSFDDGMRVIFKEAYGQSLLSKISSIYYGFTIAGTYKIATRSVKYGCQPPLANYFSQHYGTSARYYFGERQGKALLEALAGGTIGILEVLFFHSLDTIRIKRQSGDHTKLLRMVTADPIKLYNGAGITMARNFTSFSVLFGVSSMLMSLMGLESARQANLNQRFSSASLAAAVSVMATSPLDVIKTRIQYAPERVSTLSMFRQVAQKEGLTAFYKGISLKILTSLPKKALPLTLTGYFLDLWEKWQADNRNTVRNRK